MAVFSFYFQGRDRASASPPLNIGGGCETMQVMAKYPVMYTDSMNTVLRQELIRYNRLITVVHKSLRNLIRAIQVIGVKHFFPDTSSPLHFGNAAVQHLHVGDDVKLGRKATHALVIHRGEMSG